MEDKGLNICEHIWHYETIQRLLLLLRQTQTYCIDNECFAVDHIPGPNSNQLNPDYLFLGIVLIAMILFYLFKPNSRHENSKEIRENDTNLIIFRKEPEDDPSIPPSSMN